ncbi:hypothetical protein [Stieleria mannarensis]|uniref:hypothetical protein n=1 Tax=Stieleria mannarensis TaxID=2755585 RepID=UPI0015FFB325|nr:hypothetical protein [Rhodopirellula sp. JC639]
MFLQDATHCVEFNSPARSGRRVDQFRLVTCLVIFASTAAAATADSPSLISKVSPPSITDGQVPALTTASGLSRLKAEIAAVRQAYKGWGLKRTIQTYPTIRDDSSQDPVGSTDWSSQTPVVSLSDDFLRLGDRFRAERLEPSQQKMVFAYDGQVGRMRFFHSITNRPLSTNVYAQERNVAPLLPHGVLVDFYFSRHLNWLVLADAERPLFPPESVIGQPSFEEVQFNGHPCWHVRWFGINNEDLDIVSDCEVYLAKDRSLLPLRQSFETPAGDRWPEYKTIEIDSFQFDPSTGLWYPKQVTACRRWSNQLQLTRVGFEIDDRFTDTAIYSDAPVVNSKHAAPPKPVVARYAPAPVLTELAGPGSNSMMMRRIFQPQRAGGGMFAFIVVLAVLAIWFKATRLGAASRQLLGRHRTFMGAAGVALTAGVAYLSSYPPGWTTYGLTMMLVGLFGLTWIVVTVLLIGEKQISIRLVLFAATCLAICFGGYSKGIKRIQVRQRMISEVRELGGQVEMGMWHLDEEGLYLPARLSEVFGEAWSGRANRAAISYESFSEKNIDRWCLDEVQWLGLASRQQQAFDVDAETLSRIGATDSLWTLHVEGGYLDGRALTAAARFPRLIDLYFDCQHRPVAKEVCQLPHLERIWLTNAVVDDELIRSLRGIKNLDYVTLVKPRFGNCERRHDDWGIDGVEIQFATLTPAAINTLGRLSTNLNFVDCHVKLPASANVELPLTTGFSFRDCRLNNDTLLRLSNSPQLVSIGLVGTDVSVDGIEAFSQLRPDVALAMKSPRQ